MPSPAPAGASSSSSAPADLGVVIKEGSAKIGKIEIRNFIY